MKLVRPDSIITNTSEANAIAALGASQGQQPPTTTPPFLTLCRILAFDAVLLFLLSFLLSIATFSVLYFLTRELSQPVASAEIIYDICGISASNYSSVGVPYTSQAEFICMRQTGTTSLGLFIFGMYASNNSHIGLLLLYLSVFHRGQDSPTRKAILKLFFLDSILLYPASIIGMTYDIIIRHAVFLQYFLLLISFAYIEVHSSSSSDRRFSSLATSPPRSPRPSTSSSSPLRALQLVAPAAAAPGVKEKAEGGGGPNHKERGKAKKSYGSLTLLVVVIGATDLCCIITVSVAFPANVFAGSGSLWFSVLNALVTMSAEAALARLIVWWSEESLQLDLLLLKITCVSQSLQLVHTIAQGMDVVRYLLLSTLTSAMGCFFSLMLEKWKIQKRWRKISSHEKRQQREGEFVALRNARNAAEQKGDGRSDGTGLGTAGANRMVLQPKEGEGGTREKTALDAQQGSKERVEGQEKSSPPLSAATMENEDTTPPLSPLTPSFSSAMGDEKLYNFRIQAVLCTFSAALSGMGIALPLSLFQSLYQRVIYVGPCYRPESSVFFTLEDDYNDASLTYFVVVLVEVLALMILLDRSLSTGTFRVNVLSEWNRHRRSIFRHFLLLGLCYYPFMGMMVLHSLVDRGGC